MYFFHLIHLNRVINGNQNVKNLRVQYFRHICIKKDYTCNG